MQALIPTGEMRQRVAGQRAEGYDRDDQCGGADLYLPVLLTSKDPLSQSRQSSATSRQPDHVDPSDVFALPASL